MFDPHGWSEDSYYEALGSLSSLLPYTSSAHPTVPLSSQLVIQATHISRFPLRQAMFKGLGTGLNETDPPLP